MGEFKKASLEDTWKIVKNLSTVVDMIRMFCEMNKQKFNHDTEIPFGIGVDLYLIPSYGMIEKTFPALANDEWYKEHFKVLKTVGDVVDMMRVVLNEARDPST